MRYDTDNAGKTKPSARCRGSERSDDPTAEVERNISKADVWGMGATLTALNVVSPI